METIARLRGLDDYAALELMVHHGVLYIATHWGTKVWVVGDLSRRSWRVRRLDGALWWGKHKSASFEGYGNAWPLGLKITHPCFEAFQSIELTEGEGDLVAMYHATTTWGWGNFRSLPVAIPGTSCQKIDPDALAVLAAMPGGVRIWPDRDTDGGGMNVANEWARLIIEAGGRVRIVTIPDGYKDVGEYVAAKVMGARP